MGSWLDWDRNEILRSREQARFERWFLTTPYGPAYIDRAGRARSVTSDEIAQWRSSAWAGIDTMIADAPKKALVAAAAMLVIMLFGYWALGALGINGFARNLGIGIAIVIVEAGLIGLDVHDYFRDWRQLRDGIEAQVAGRAPLPINPEQTRIPCNWFLIGQYGIAALIVLFYLASHIDERVLNPRWTGWIIFVVPIAWALHFSEKWHDRKAQGRLRR